MEGRGLSFVGENRTVATGTSELRVTLPPTLSEEEARLLLAVKLYEVGRISLGQSAEIAGVSVRVFLDTLRKQHVPILDYPPDELRREVDG